jgi:hypothetical protein
MKWLLALCTTLVAALALTCPQSSASELEELKAQMEQMQQQMQQMQKKIARLEHENAQQRKRPSGKEMAGPPSATTTEDETNVATSGTAPGDQMVTIAPTAVTIEGRASQVRNRPAMNDQQEAAPRPNDLTLDPKYRGFVPIPNTEVLIKFNAKPRVDFTDDPQNTGNEDRFVTAQIPVDGDPFKNGGNQFNINARGSQLSIDVRAPNIDGHPRFYYQNDFFGSGGGELPFRVRQLYGEIYNFVVGQTFSVFEDPDAWPDTVDYEGPNSAVFARRPLVRYQ